jgi:hypothetical protein
MIATWWQRIGALSGPVAMALFVVADSIGLPLPFPKISDSAASLQRTFAERVGQVHAMGVLEGLATLFILIFIVYLWNVLRAAEGMPAVLSNLTLASGGVFAAMNWTWCAIMVALAYAANAGMAGTVRAFWALGSVLVIYLDYPLALWFAGIAVVLFGSNLLPRWLAWWAAATSVAWIFAGLLGATVSSGFFSPNGGYLQAVPAGLEFVWVVVVGVRLFGGEQGR